MDVRIEYTLYSQDVLEERLQALLGALRSPVSNLTVATCMVDVAHVLGTIFVVEEPSS